MGLYPILDGPASKKRRIALYIDLLEYFQQRDGFHNEVFFFWFS